MEENSTFVNLIAEMCEKADDFQRIKNDIVYEAMLLINENNELKKCNDDLKDIIRWRDAKEELPDRDEKNTRISKELQVMVVGRRKTISTGYYNFEDNNWYKLIGFDSYPIIIKYWRPLNL